jgi:hypothetical protein
VSHSAANGEPGATYFVRRALMPVLIDPGSTVVSHTPYAESSCRAAVANARIAAFEAL